MLRYRLLAAVSAAILSAVSPARAQSRSITLAEALRRAESVDPQVARARGDVRNAGAAVRTAYGGFLPDVRTSANFSNSFSEGESRIDPVTGEPISGSISSTGLNVGAGASYDLFTGFRRGKDLAAAKAQRSSAKAALARAVGEVGRVAATEDSSLVRIVAIADTAALIAEAANRAPEAVRADAAERAARASLGAIKAQYFPSLNLQANTQFAGNARM